MPRPSPRDVYEDPKAFWPYLTQERDDDVEGQHFDRKEAGSRAVRRKVQQVPLSNGRTLSRVWSWRGGAPAMLTDFNMAQIKAGIVRLPESLRPFACEATRT